VLFLSSEMNVEKLILLVMDHQAIYDASDSDHRNRLHSQPLGKNCTGDGRRYVEGFAAFLLALMIIMMTMTTKTTATLSVINLCCYCY
jgi:hypothetical protein